MSFVADTGSNLIGTFVGAALALAGAWWLERRGARRQESRELQKLADRLYRARALRDVGRQDPPDRLSDEQDKDRRRCTSSVIETRHVVVNVSNRLRAEHPARTDLERMYASCQRYLSDEEAHPNSYVNLLVDLRSDLDRLIREIAAVDSRVVVKDLGSAKALVG